MWVVVLNVRTNTMGVLTRKEREEFLKSCQKLKITIPSIVVAKFDFFEDAVKYAKDIHEVNQLIYKL